MNRHTRTGSLAATGAVTLLLTLTTACGVAHKGDVQPDAVEKQAHTFTTQTLDALRSTIGAPTTTTYENKWTKCATETPGQHRFEYVYAVTIPVPTSKAKPALAAARADFTRRGYTLAYVPNPSSGAGATPPKTKWIINLNVRTTSFLLYVDSDCVFTRHDPKTTS
ncbi:hypothetical protein RVR_4054 [Actinacidiphila reveromycinica]|uniref:Lipoprotein n=1 Tax=Actinacidiphila reveromycinica TaxID=659352 RepID=A0A7U3USW9_9ACTN|nr:hypothetical protein [Streptomyces sp. SN-593]BBA98028.1 hypothetical protein RVR_4054 [Streptomyces sp. SN-593]